MYMYNSHSVYPGNYYLGTMEKEMGCLLNIIDVNSLISIHVPVVTVIKFKYCLLCGSKS